MITLYIYDADNFQQYLDTQYALPGHRVPLNAPVLQCTRADMATCEAWVLENGYDDPDRFTISCVNYGCGFEH